jgi:hypothetical protein
MARRLRPVELEFIRSAPLRLVYETGLLAAPKQVYGALADDVPGWSSWFDAVSMAIDTHGGAGREVKLRAGAFFSESVLAREPDERYAYRVDATNVPGLLALVEEWRIAPLPGGGSRVRWTCAADGSRLTKLVLRLSGPGLGGSFRGAMRSLDQRLAAGDGV